MAGIIRKIAQIFGGGLTPSGNIETFGSKTVGGSSVWSDDPKAIQTAQWLQGWKGALAAGGAPFWQDDNAALYVLSYQIAYMLQRGVPEYDPDTTYTQDDVCRIGLIWYVSLTDPNQGNNPAFSPTNWDLWTNQVMKGVNVIKAWVCFDGTGGLGNCAILGGFNVSSVTKLGTGIYVVNFQTALPTANYGFSGSAGAKDGAASGSGDNNVICGGTPGQVGLKTQSQLKVLCWEPNLSGSGSLEDSQAITVQVFGA